jgi:hypothetical protein
MQIYRYQIIWKNQGSFVSDYQVEAPSRWEALEKTIETKLRYETKEWDQVEIKLLGQKS